MLFPAANPTAEHTLRCLHKYISVNGMIDEIRTDAGVDFTSKAVDSLKKYLDIKHTIGIVGWHPSNDYCNKLPELKHLCLTDVEARRQIAVLDSMEVTKLKPGVTFYLDLRYQGWFKDTDRNTWLRDKEGLDYVSNTYVLKCTATKYDGYDRKRICYVCPVLDGNTERILTNFEVERLAYRRRLGKNYF